MSKLTPTSKALDLNNPEDAKFFLRGIRIQGKEITFVDLVDGRRLSIEEMTNEELVRYAKDVYFDYCGGIEGKGGFVELDDGAREQ